MVADDLLVLGERHRPHGVGPVKEDPYDQLITIAYDARDETRRQYAAAAAKARAAEEIADAGMAKASPASEVRTFEEAEELARSLQRCDGLSNAFSVLHDLDEAAFGNHDKWLLIDALEAALGRANEDQERRRREILHP